MRFKMVLCVLCFLEVLLATEACSLADVFCGLLEDVLKTTVDLFMLAYWLCFSCLVLGTLSNLLCFPSKLFPGLEIKLYRLLL